MRTFVCVLAVLAFTSSAMAETVDFTENFNSYSGGSTSWGGLWNDPTNGLKLDAFTKDGTLGPRTGASGTRDAHAELGETGIPRIDFSADFFWDHARAKVDAFFVVLSDGPLTAREVPTDNSSTAEPINAIAWGHTGTGGKDYSFFDGQTWTVCGWAAGSKGSEVVSGYVEADGSWHAEATPTGGAGAGTLAIADFSFDTVSIISDDPTNNSWNYYSGIDNISVSAAPIPEPGTLVLLGLGVPLLLMLYRRRS